MAGFEPLNSVFIKRKGVICFLFNDDSQDSSVCIVT